MSLTKNSTIYLLSNIINAAIPFLLLPILTRVLSPEEYGQVAMFQTFIAGLAAFIGLNSIGAANRKFFDEGNTQQDISQFNGVCLQVLIGSSLLVLVVSIIFNDVLKVFLSISSSWIYASIFVSALTFVLNLRLGQWQVRGNAIKYGTLQIFNSILNMGLSLLFVIAFHYGAQGRIDAQIIAVLITAVAAFLLLREERLVIFWCWRPDFVKQVLRFGVPLIPHVFGVFLLSAVDRFVINQQLGLKQAGIYMVAVQLSMALNIVFDAINKAYVPWLFDVLKRNKLSEKKVVVKYTYFYFCLLIIIVPLGFLIGPFFLILLSGEEYRSATQVIGLLCFGQILNGMYLMVTNYIFYAQKTGRLALVTISSGLINIFLLVYLVDRQGIVGAALAFTIAKLIQFLLTWFQAYKTVKMPWFLNDKR
ncbi:lipopolysaccharide biosynthesis protein [Vibrio alginolyticus]